MIPDVRMTEKLSPIFPTDWEFLFSVVKESACALWPIRNFYLAGGAIRDLYMKRPIKDLDFWIMMEEEDVDEAQKESEQYYLSLEDFMNEVKENLNGAGLEYKITTGKFYDLGYASDDNIRQGWEFILDTKDLTQGQYQFNILVSTHANLKALLEYFDYDFCRAGYDGHDFYTGTGFWSDEKSVQFTLRNAVSWGSAIHSASRYIRWRKEKYPEFKFRNLSGYDLSNPKFNKDTERQKYEAWLNKVDSEAKGWLNL